MRQRPDTGLLILGHGSTVNADSSAPTLAHAAEIRRRNIFAGVECAFWKEEPSFRDALAMFPDATEVFVVPNFISEGYFTQTVIPRELELAGPLTTRRDGQIWKYCEPVGNNPLMTDLLLARARETLRGRPLRDATLLIAAHGTDLNENSAVAAKREAGKIRAFGLFADVLNAYMEESPSITDWQSLAGTEAVVVVPFFISDGLHSYEDIPRMLGIAPPEGADHHQPGEIFQRNPHRLGQRQLYYAPSIGSEPGFADIILDQVTQFAREGRDGADKSHSRPRSF